MSTVRSVGRSLSLSWRIAVGVMLLTAGALLAQEPSSTTKSDESSDVGESSSNSEANLDLAKRLNVAQTLVAELKRGDLINAGMDPETRDKFVLAHKTYEQLREEVIRRCHIARSDKTEEKSLSGNYELSFNGVTSYVEIPSLKYDGESPYTIEAIVSPAPIPGYQVNPEIHQYAHYMAFVSDAEYGGIELSVHPRGLSFDVNSQQQGWYVTAAKESLPFVETRMHVAAVLDGDEIRLYQNGVLVDSQPFAGPVGVSPFTMRIGCSPHPVTGVHELFCGRIDEVRFSNAALYSKDYKPLEELTVDGNTMALYHFDEGGGDVARDASGHGRHGVIHDARWARVGD